MTFKDQVKRDITDVFINVDEFADEHTVNGKKMRAVIDDNELQEHPASDSIAGIFGEQTTVYVAADDYGDAPRRDATITIDNVKYRVAGVSTEMGVYRIIIERWVSNNAVRTGWR